jgi:hypothetical protein
VRVLRVPEFATTLWPSRELTLRLLTDPICAENALVAIELTARVLIFATGAVKLLV